MKKLILILLLLLKISVYSQVTIFSENCGVGTSLSTSLYNGWNNNVYYDILGRRILTPIEGIFYFKKNKNGFSKCIY